MSAVPKPMLAKEYDAERVKFPCYVQPKLDGVRLLVSRRGDRLVMHSRTGKSMDHLASLLEPHLLSLLPAGMVLDGELYIHRAGFQSIVSMVRNTRLSDSQRDRLEYHVYDVAAGINAAATYEQRLARLRELLETSHASAKSSRRVLLVETLQVKNIDGVEAALKRFIKAGYEGVMVRDPKDVYKPGSRSNGLLKYKLFQDAEFKIVAVSEATGKDAGTAVLRCVTVHGREFNVRPLGTQIERARLLQNASTIIGKLLTVRFQELTDDGIPRFPVGITVRDYE